MLHKIIIRIVGVNQVSDYAYIATTQCERTIFTLMAHGALVRFTYFAAYIDTYELNLGPRSVRLQMSTTSTPLKIMTCIKYRLKRVKSQLGCKNVQLENASSFATTHLDVHTLRGFKIINTCLRWNKCWSSVRTSHRNARLCSVLHLELGDLWEVCMKHSTMFCGECK